MKNITIIVLIAIIGAFIMWQGLNKSEVIECNKWANQAEEYRTSGFYILQWQSDQCAAHHITINAQIQK